MAFVWAAREVDESESYARLVRRDRVFQRSASLQINRVHAADVPRVAREIIGFVLDSLCSGSRDRKLGHELLPVLEPRRAERA